MQVRDNKDKLYKFDNEGTIPNWNNNRSINELMQIFSLNNKSNNIFGKFLQNIAYKQEEKYLKPTSQVTTVLDIGCGKGALIEDLITYYGVTGIGISKYAEREQQTKPTQAEYHQVTLQDKLPTTIEDNSIDFIISLYTLQYIKDAPTLIQDIYRKLKVGGEALISLGTPSHIDPRLLYQIEKDNKEIIISSEFTERIPNSDFSKYNCDHITEQNIESYKKNAGIIHTLYIKKSDFIKDIKIPKYRSNKEIWFTPQDWLQSYPNYQNNIPTQNLEVLGEIDSMPITNSYINLNTLSYTFSYIHS